MLRIMLYQHLMHRVRSSCWASLALKFSLINSDNSFLLWWDHCHKAQVAIQLFDEHHNYFSHMPRLSTAPDPIQTPARDESEPRALFAADKPSLLTFSLVCCLLLFLSLFSLILLNLAIPLAPTPQTPTLTHNFLLPSTPTQFTWLCRASRGKCHYGNRGRGSVCGRRGERDEGERMGAGRCRGIQGWSSAAELIFFNLRKIIKVTNLLFRSKWKL